MKKLFLLILVLAFVKNATSQDAVGKSKKLKLQFNKNKVETQSEKKIENTETQISNTSTKNKFAPQLTASFKFIDDNKNYFIDANNLNSGIYFYKLTTNNFSEMKKMILIK